MSKENLSKIIDTSKSGKVFEPHDINNITEFIQEIYKDKTLKQNYSMNARNYAENNFDIKLIAKKFEKIFNHVSNQ